MLCNTVDNCGLQCVECVAPANSTTFCDTSGGNPACDFSCYGGYHECPGYDDDCFPDSDPNHCGGASGCLECTVPSGNGTPLCINNQCTIQCNTGYHEENDNCVPNDNPNCCGDYCEPCWSPEFGEEFCNDSGAEAFCDFTCSSGYHRCNTGNSQHASGDDCVFNGSVEHCGSNCDPCPAPETGTETGYGTCISTGYDWVCSIECFSGFHREGNSCVINDDPWCCGANCQDCPEPADATATCINGACGFVCNESYHECGGQCVSDYSEQHCGTSCMACFSPAFGFATCDGTSCGIQCYPGYHEESGDCIANSSTECCGNQCEECTGPANSTSECIGGTHCEWTCNNNYHQCGNECVEDDSVDHCGTLCTPCPEPDNTVSYCEQEQCQWDCLEDYYDNDGEPANGCEDYCSPDGYEDVPDDSFLDNDCDGLDGTWDDAIFVSTDGSDVLPGTGDQPKRSIQAAINAAYASSPKKYVIVSMGTYYESVTLKNGVSVYGGYSKIHNWQRSNGYGVIVSGGVKAMTASNINNSTIIDRLTIVSANAGMSENSYAVYLNECTDALIFQHCNIETGRGGDGEDGVAAYISGANGQVGGNASGRTGGVGGFSLCGMGYNGGSGGSGGSDGAIGSGPNGGGGGNYGDWEPFNCCDGCLSGLSGGSANTGAVGNDGTTGSTSGGIINGNWVGEVGGNGGMGNAGLGGSGGGGGGGCKKWSFLFSFCPSENGGGGGGGGGAGCGGEGGYGGNYGGGSFGFLLYNSSPDIIDCNITSETGGNGGSGGAGSSGGLGGQRGSFAEGSGEAQHGGSGARGGDGGRGGNGGGGSGGVSYCVYRAGTADPYLDPANQYSYGGGGEGGNFSGEADSGDIY